MKRTFKKTFKIKLLVFLILIGVNFSSFAQENSVGINTLTPNTGAALEIFSTSKGLLPPRLTTIQRDAINPKPAGLMVYNSDLNCLQYWNGTKWIGQCSNLGSGDFKDCSTGKLNGTYAEGEVMTALNTLTLTVMVTEVGPWNVFSDVVNGISFSGNGTFNVIGEQNVTLTATGTPTAGGDFTFKLNLDTSVCTKSITFKSSLAPDLSASTTGLKLLYKSNNSSVSGEVNGQLVTATFSNYTNIQNYNSSGGQCGVSLAENSWWIGSVNSSSMTIKFNKTVSNFKVFQTHIDLGEVVSYVLKLKGVVVSGNIALSTAYSQNCNTDYTVSGTQITKSIGSAQGGALYNVGEVWFDEIIISHNGLGGGSILNFYLGLVK
ncbi:hypothetical protein QWY99_07725 [Flavobacterium branchiarum]|uniref:Uncharacterized protein n=1 Tax=Flavobacterium branchiarum TaxID=1114870 RepID=A0ABV5FQG0_9FLAO|nr:hypothetical protein [Flavobacterium branchiarum]MDN3672939.1 hypothetical protein [Flavobacterium branchiarum]